MKSSGVDACAVLHNRHINVAATGQAGYLNAASWSPLFYLPVTYLLPTSITSLELSVTPEEIVKQVVRFLLSPGAKESDAAWLMNILADDAEEVPIPLAGLPVAPCFLANISHQVFETYSFGYFENVLKERFSSRYSGRFRVAHGKPPHPSSIAFSGSESFSTAEAMLLNTANGEGLRLTPLILWYPCPNHRDADRDNGHCYFFDKLRGEGSEATATFKAAGFPCQLQFSASDPETTDLLSQLVRLKAEDPGPQPIGGLKVITRKT